ncbi:MAG TPA: TetR/AcrR family transcriptional regulator [Sporichthyaceae bacterium]|jgi:AcrR family transcriptional regulator|nr:TetR/AcrR family transcriptional regulator [Sporichthyaceae bacterium]
MPGSATALLDAEEFTLREQEILDVCAELLTEIGYERLTIDAVAARARASKATIYRRWPGKPALVGAAVRHVTDTASIAPEYTGDLRADLLSLITNARDRFSRQGRLMAGMVNAMQTDPELAALLRADIARCRASVDELIDRYALDIQVTAQNSELIRQLAPATLLMRVLVTGEPVDDDLLVRLVDHVMLPLLSSGRP